MIKSRKLLSSRESSVTEPTRTSSSSTRKELIHLPSRSSPEMESLESEEQRREMEKEFLLLAVEDN